MEIDPNPNPEYPPGMAPPDPDPNPEYPPGMAGMAPPDENPNPELPTFPGGSSGGPGGDEGQGG